MWRALIADLRDGVTPGVMAARFHAGLIDAFAAATLRFAAMRPVRRVALTGGVFANRILLEGLSDRLTELGFAVLLHRRVPANDGGLSFGQICVAAAREVAALRSS